MKIDPAVTWALVKGKSYIKLLWGGKKFNPFVIQPELMGVLRPDLNELDEDMEAFFQSLYVTPDQLKRIVQGRSDEREILRKAKSYISTSQSESDPQAANQLKQIILGGVYPYKSSSSGQPTTSRGVVNWMESPAPTFSPEVLRNLLRIDELWVWNDKERDWTTIQIIGDDCVLMGKDRHFNAFADPAWAEIESRNPDDKYNPLAGKHPFVAFCPNELEGYHWGRSEILNVGLLQKSINSRIDGTNKMLRKQEDPPRMFSGAQSVNQTAYSKLNKPGGFLSDGNPNAKIQDLKQEIPDTWWTSLHEFERMYDDMAGFSPVMQGRGEGSVRSQGHAETLVKTSSPRFKDRALAVERNVEALGGLALDILQAHVPEKLYAWVPESQGGIETKIAPENPASLPPAPTMKEIEFLYSHLPENCKVTVDAHSASPAFSGEARALLFDLLKAGAISKEQLVEHTHPPGEDAIISDIEKREIEEALFLQQHPEAALAGKGKKHK
jgi:hypothetical protein